MAVLLVWWCMVSVSSSLLLSYFSYSWVLTVLCSRRVSPDNSRGSRFKTTMEFTTKTFILFHCLMLNSDTPLHHTSITSTSTTVSTLIPCRIAVLWRNLLGRKNLHFPVDWIFLFKGSSSSPPPMVASSTHLVFLPPTRSRYRVQEAEAEVSTFICPPPPPDYSVDEWVGV